MAHSHLSPGILRYLLDNEIKKRTKPEMVEKVRVLLGRRENPEVIFDTLFSLQKEVYQSMENTFLKPFLESELFWELQKDLPNLREDYFDEVYLPSEKPAKPKEKQEDPTSTAQSGASAASPGTLTTQATKHKPGVLFTAELKDVLVNSTALYYFMQFAERHAEVNNMINFYLTVESYFSYGSQKVQDDDEILRQDAKQMYTLHFAPGAPQPIRLGSKYGFLLPSFFFFLLLRPSFFSVHFFERNPL